MYYTHMCPVVLNFSIKIPETLRKFGSNKLNQLCILYKTKSKFRLGETNFVTRYDYRGILLLIVVP